MWSNILLNTYFETAIKKGQVYYDRYSKPGADTLKQ
ncbi:hypothetical protein ABMB67_000350 [Halalkalibacter oceani]